MFVLRLIRRLLCPVCFPLRGIGYPCEAHEGPSYERWASKVAKLATPDQIIAGRIVASFTKDLATNWTLHRRKSLSNPFAIDRSERETWYKRWNKQGSKVNYYICDHVLENGEIFIAYSHHADDHFYVNDVPISREDGRFIIKSYTELRNKIIEAKRLADKAKKEMEENEAKWNLVENLFKLRRTAEGALVPVFEEIERTNNADEELSFLAGPRRNDLDLSFLGP